MFSPAEVDLGHLSYRSHLAQSGRSVMVRTSLLEKLGTWTVKNPGFVQHLNLEGNFIQFFDTLLTEIRDRFENLIS